ncbi:MAG: hypothetical protein KJ915_03810 [Candidatus Omnitrophica bacterium]|nr:hypothetical protein [Candidatus Omnitrophota bacterium]
MKDLKVIFIAVLILFSLFCGMNSYAGDFNLTEPEEITLIVDEKPYTFKFYRYDPPYMYKTLWESKEEADISTPEGTARAINSASGRDRLWYLSLHDESAIALLMEIDKNPKSKVLKEDGKGKPFPADITKRNSYFLWYYKIEIEINGKQYATIFKHSIRDGKFDPYLNVSEYVKQGDVWLSTQDLTWELDPVGGLLGARGYDKFMELCKKGKVYDEMHEPVPLKFTARWEKDKYEIQEGRLLEPIKLSVELRNVSWDKRNLEVLNILEPLGLSVDVDMWLKDEPEGVKVVWDSRKKYVPEKKDIYELKYNESLTAEYVLSKDNYSKSVSIDADRDKNIKNSLWLGGKSDLLPGIYEIQAQYNIYLDMELPLRKNQDFSSEKVVESGRFKTEPMEITFVDTPKTPEQLAEELAEKEAKEVKEEIERKKQEEIWRIEEEESVRKIKEESANRKWYDTFSEGYKTEEDPVDYTNALKVELKIYKNIDKGIRLKEYELGTQIEISVQVINTAFEIGDINVIYPEKASLGDCMRIEITDEQGKCVYKTDYNEDFRPRWPDVIKIHRWSKIGGRYILPLNENFTKGKYRIKAYYKISNYGKIPIKQGLGLINGTWESEPLEFIVSD